MNKALRSERRIGVSKKFLKYGFGCLFSLTIKISLTHIFIYFLWLSPQISYVLVHIVLLFYSFTYHTKVTFNNKLSMRLFKEFCLSVMAFKVADYLIFLVGVELLKKWLAGYLDGTLVNYAVSFSIAISTIFIFMARFVVYKKILSLKTSNE